ncbi:hypothetical protein ACLBWS_18415, partial [Brucellaceae bacterium D45D]
SSHQSSPSLETLNQTGPRLSLHNRFNILKTCSRRRREHELHKMDLAFENLSAKGIAALELKNKNGVVLSHAERLGRIRSFQQVLDATDDSYKHAFRAKLRELMSRVAAAEQNIQHQIQRANLEDDCMKLLEALQKAILSGHDREIDTKAAALERTICAAEKLGSTIRSQIAPETNSLKSEIQSARDRIKQSEVNSYQGPGMEF